MKRLLKVGFLLFALVLGGFALLKTAGKPRAYSNLTSASVTLSNSRLSWYGGIAIGPSAGTSNITIDTASMPDNDTNHLFPQDTVCFAPSSLSGCRDNTAYTVASIKDTDEFNITTDLGSNLLSSDVAVASQSGSFTIAFTTASEIPADGDILITIPMSDSASGNDGFPDYNTNDSTGTSNVSGFDLNSIAAADISTTGCTDANWNATETITAGSGTTDHTIRVDRQTSSCAAATAITVTIDASPGILNPAPKTSGHTQGTADRYMIRIQTRDGGDTVLDQVDVRVAPVEGVLVSATVDETLTFIVTAVNSGVTVCGQAADVTTTAYSVPWGTLSTANSFSEAGQGLEVSTNADGGYSVTIEENDQMNKDTDVCDSPAADTADETDNCIKDTVCGATACSESAARDWTDASTYHGLGISLEDVDGSDAVWDYDGKAAETTCTSGTFCARQIADQQAGNSKASIMSNSGPVSSKNIYVCYRIDISNTQPAGYYQNKVKYTATATF